MHLGALGDHLQGYMGYQQIRWDSQMQNILLVGTWHPRHWHQGPIEVGHVHLEATYGVIWGISRFIKTTRHRGTRPSTQTTGINYLKVYVCYEPPGGQPWAL